ncbi:hypothetical protein LTR74_008604 [Friedmanniomyces endolithicus]|nr:hypothetical protein LTR74_008604 [Friedmanniomyces endolithicus]
MEPTTQGAASSNSGLVGHDRTLNEASASTIPQYPRTDVASSLHQVAPVSSIRMDPGADQSSVAALESTYFRAPATGGEISYNKYGYYYAPSALETSPYEVPQYHATPYYHQQLPGHESQAMSTHPQARHAHNAAPIYRANPISTDQMPLISKLNTEGTSPAKILKRVKIVHTVEPDNGQVLSRYKIGYYRYGERSKSEAPVSKVILPHAFGKTEDVWRCAKKGCRSCNMTANGYTDLTAALAKAHGFSNITTKNWYKDKCSVIAPSPRIAVIPALAADPVTSRPMAHDYLTINPVTPTKSSTAPYSMPAPDYPPLQDASTLGRPQWTAHSSPEGELSDISPLLKRKRKTSSGAYEDRESKRLRNELAESPEGPEDLEAAGSSFFELQIEDEISVGFQGVEAGLRLARKYSYSTLCFTNPTPSPKHEDDTARSDAISVVGLKCAGFNGMFTDISKGAWGYDAPSAMGDSAKNGAESDMELPDGVNYLRGHTCL